MSVAAVIGMGNAGKRHFQAWEDAGWTVAGLDKGHDWRMHVEFADAVSICTPDDLHCEMACFALEHGKHVLCEKPLTHSMKELEQIEAAVHKSDGLTFGCNFPLRHVGGKQSEPFPTSFADAGYEHGRRDAYLGGWRARVPDYSLLCGGGIHLVDLILSHNRADVIEPMEPAVVACRADGTPMYECGHFRVTGYGRALLARITCNFVFNGRHRVWLTAWDEHGPHEVLNLTDEPYDKLADIRQFISDVENGLPGNGADAIRANRLCLEMSLCTPL